MYNAMSHRAGACQKNTKEVSRITVKLGYNEQLGTGQICSL